MVSALHVPESLQEQPSNMEDVGLGCPDAMMLRNPPEEQIWFNETWAIFSSAEEDRNLAKKCSVMTMSV